MVFVNLKFLFSEKYKRIFYHCRFCLFVLLLLSLHEDWSYIFSREVPINLFGVGSI